MNSLSAGNYRGVTVLDFAIAIEHLHCRMVSLLSFDIRIMHLAVDTMLHYDFCL